MRRTNSTLRSAATRGGAAQRPDTAPTPTVRKRPRWLEGSVARGLGLAMLCVAMTSSAEGQALPGAELLSGDLAQEAQQLAPVYATQEETYELEGVHLDFPQGETPPGFAIASEMLAVVVAPVDAPGPRPVAVFIHGQSLSCFDPTTGEATSAWPCPEGYQAVPSHRGYLAYQRALAAQGWITMSIASNGIGGNIISYGDASTGVLFRAKLVELHLQQWANWAAGQDPDTAPSIIGQGITPDLQNLLLVGHSRGGGAANQVALKSVTGPDRPWRARGQVLIGSVISEFNPAPTVPTVLLLPACDGDVLDLQGQRYADLARDMNLDSALRSSILIDGANHKFFNAEWDPATAEAQAVTSDDTLKLFGSSAPQGSCNPADPRRLSGATQRALGALYVAAAAQTLVQGNTQALPLLDGPGLCSSDECGVRIWKSGLGGNREPLLVPEPDSVLANGSSITVAPCLTERDENGSGTCITSDMPRVAGVTRTPHFGSTTGGVGANEPSHTALHAQWSASGEPAHIALSHSRLSQNAQAVVARVIVQPQALDTRFGLTLVDASGRELNLGSATVEGIPPNAGEGTGLYWGQEVYLPLDRGAASAEGIDLNDLWELQLTPESESGDIWLLDAWGYRPGLASSGTAAARFELDMGNAFASSDGMLHIPGDVFGTLQQTGEFYYALPDGIEGLATIPAGSQEFELTIELPELSFTTNLNLRSIRGIASTYAREVVLPQDAL